MTLSDTFDMAALDAELTLDEGKERIPYIDSRGHLSGGVGRNLGKGFSDDEIALMFANDKRDAIYDLDMHATWWRKLPAAQQRVMVNLCFNLGWSRFAGFVRFLAAMQAWDWPRAAAELKDSLWWKEVKERGPRVVARLLATDGAPIA
jgi:lysozyme